MIREKLGVIGVGNMGASILEGLLSKKLMKPAQIMVYDRDLGKARFFAKKNKVHLAESNRDLVQKSDLVLLAIKPQDLRDTAQEFKQEMRSSQVLLSILAGTPISKLRAVLGGKIKLVRAMPNLGAKVGASMTVVTGSDANSLLLAQKILSGCGKTLELSEKYFDLVTAVSGSGPAYFFLLMEELIKSAVSEGLSEDKASQLVVQTAFAASLLAGSGNVKPGELRRQVTSKGGTTEAALKVFESGHLSALVRDAVNAAQSRGRELSRG